ncbi:uncharacterized protein LOC143131544 [Alosa pseudoharengus]|uniref:uncharacterized protein LOC143131544 n=1 Tax=Alosa pseudoharengus TaxID=34774 RepID=UPI003F8CCAC4
MDCTHVKELKALHQVPEVLEFIQGVESTTVYRERAIAVVSEDNICFQIAVEEQVVYSNPPTELFESVGGVLQLIPPTKSTCGCGATMSQTPVLDGQPLLFCSTAVFRAQTYKYICMDSTCNTSHCFDGGKTFILNMGSFLIHHAVLRDYMFHFLFSGTSMFNYFRVWEARQRDSGSHFFLTYHKFRMAWHAFLGLLELDTKEGFQCPICQDEPKELVMDGTTLGYHQRYKEEPQESEDSFLGTGR